MSTTELDYMDAAYDDETIPQDEKQGPGWFLNLSYVLIVVFCLYYLFTYWNWQSDYEKDLERSREPAAEVNK